TQVFVEQPDGGVELQLRLNDLTAVSKWVLGFGSSATVLAPAELQQLVRQEAAALLRDLDELDRGGSENTASP
ncbi:MAG: WYL domain-containing protein, partial [Planctomyces sp.]